MKKINVLHLASFDGNIGDNANHDGFYRKLRALGSYEFVFTQLEIREFYWKKKYFDESFVSLVNEYDLLIVGGGNYFELWVEDSHTGTSIALELNLLDEIKTPILFNSLGVDPGQGASEKNIKKFERFLSKLIERNELVSVRNDGARKNIFKHIDKYFHDKFIYTLDAGFFCEVDEPSNYYKGRNYIAINIANDMHESRFVSTSYEQFLQTFANFAKAVLAQNSELELVFVPHIYRDLRFITDFLEFIPDEYRRRRISVTSLLHGDEGFKEVMSVYKGANLVIANRFHANVCPIGMGVPTIGLFNYVQIESLYEELNSKQYVDVDKADFDKDLIKMINQTSLNEFNEAEYSEYLEKIIAWLDIRMANVGKL